MGREIGHDADRVNLDTVAALRAAIRDPADCLDTSAARASYAFRAESLERLARAVAIAGPRAMLVKGAALALTVYPRPWLRGMSDVDLLVPPSDREALVAALERAGCVRLPPPPGRPMTHVALDEVQLVLARGVAALTVEVHSGLDKLVSRPVPWADIWARARPAPTLPGLFVPSLEDHFLLVVQHAAGAELRHPIAFVDLELLLRAGAAPDKLLAGARVSRLRTATWLLLRALQVLDAPSVTPDLVGAFRPTLARRLALQGHYRPGAYPFVRGELRLGLSWALWQSVVRDDVAHWLLGLAGYGARRALERIGDQAKRAQ